MSGKCARAKEHARGWAQWGWAQRGWAQWGFVALLTLSACNRLVQEFDRLLFQGGKGAVDVRVFAKATHGWFAGIPVYFAIDSAVYPPASYLMLWPVFGWLDFTATRFLWAGVSVLLLIWLVRLAIRASQAETLPVKILVGLVPIFYACRATIGNGQLGILILPALVTALALFRSRPEHVGRNVAAVALMSLALVKPNFTAPFFWIALFAAGTGAPGDRKWWPGFAVAGAYLGLTLAASWFQQQDPLTLMIEWVGRAQDGVVVGALEKPGYGSQMDIVYRMRKDGVFPEAVYEALRVDGPGATIISLSLLGGLGAWVYRYRRVDLWILLGVSAVIARLWTYHQVYDDILLVLPTIALFRLARRVRTEEAGGTSRPPRLVCYGVLAAAGFVAIVPATVIEANARLDAGFVAIQTWVWVAMLLTLAWEAERARSASIPSDAR